MSENAKNFQIPNGPPCRVLILGAGPTALGALYRLVQLKKQQFIPDHVQFHLLEQESEVGGLARSVVDENGFCWDLGVHVMGISKYRDFVDALTDCVPGWRVVPRRAMVDMAHVMMADDGGAVHSHSFTDFYVPYPVQNSIPYLPSALKHRCLEELSEHSVVVATPPPLAKVQQQMATIPRGQDFDKFSLALFGPTLQNIFIRPYNEKVWTVRLDEMGTSWLQGRVPLIDTAQLARRCALERVELLAEDNQRPSAFRYPAQCRGVGEIWHRFAQRFPADTFQLGHRAISIDPLKKCVQTICNKVSNEKLHEKGGEEELSTETEEETAVWPYDLLISTIPLTELGRISGLAPELPLKHSTVVLVGIGIFGGQSEFAHQLSWAYYPRPEIIFYRCTVLSNFSPEMVPHPDDFSASSDQHHQSTSSSLLPSTSSNTAASSIRSSSSNECNPYWSVLCEIGQSADTEVPNSEQQKAQIVQRVIQDLIKVGVLRDESDVCSNWVKYLPFGYPIPTLNRDHVLTECHEQMEKHNIYSRGRFGGWRYEVSNQDHSFQIGLELIDRLFLGISETLNSGFR